MALITNNAINLNSIGITGYNGLGTFSGTAVVPHNVIVGGATSDVLVNIDPSTAGLVLTSNGVSADPSFQASPGSFSANTDNGTATPLAGVLIFDAVTQAGSSVSFSGSGNTVSLNTSDVNNNTNIGLNSGNTTLSGGSGGTGNASLGAASLVSLTSGNNNTAVGQGSASALITGSGCCLYGNSSGSNYSSSESYNIIVGVNAGSATESNVMRLGGGTGTGAYQQNLSFISGITGSTPVDANSPQVILCDSTDNVTVVSDATPGYVLTSNSPNSPTFQPSVAFFPYTIEGSSFLASPNNGYFCTGNITATLPASPSNGSVVVIYTESTVIVTVTANAGQTIRLNTSVSASAGTAQNVTGGSSLTLVYKSNTTQWCVTAVVGSWTIT
jgi:hypothetical protein